MTLLSPSSPIYQTMTDSQLKLASSVLNFKCSYHPIYIDPSPEERVRMVENVGEQKVLEALNAREASIKMEAADPFRYGFEQDYWKDSDELLNQFPELVVLGGNRCLAAETLIWNPVTESHARVDEIKGSHYVSAWDGTKLVTVSAEEPFLKPVSDIFEIRLSNGESFKASAAHRVLDDRQEWTSVGELREGSRLCPAQSTSDTSPSRFRLGVRRLIQRVEGFLSGCLERLRSYDEQLPAGLGIGQGMPPSQADAPAHSDPCDTSRHSPSAPLSHLRQGMLDAQGSTGAGIHPGLRERRPSTQDARQQPSALSCDTESRASCRPCRSAYERILTGLRSIAGSFLQRSIASFAQLGSDCIFLNSSEVIVITKTYCRQDVVWDFTVPVFHNYMLGGVIHHNSAKSSYAAKRVAQMFVGQHRGVNEWPEWVKERCEKRGVRIWCLHQSAQSSIAMQQTLVYNNIPPELRSAKKNKFTNISYSQKNGFSEGTAVYNGNQIWFLNYSQDIKVVEGGEPDMIWCDELVPADWLETLRYRLVTRNGKLLVTFTPIQGYTKTVKDFISTARITDWKESELLPGQNIIGVPPGNMPYRARNVHGRHACIWFHSKLNPYNNWQRMVDTLKGKSSHDIKIRAYGWADATAGAQFPVFGEHNIFPLEALPSEGTNYFVVDPAGARNWFMLWGRVCAKGILWIYQEHPGQEYGEWSLPSDKADGKPGPAQRAGAGRGIDDYSELITSLDGEADIAERYIDPKAAGTTTVTKEGGVTLLDLLATAKRPLYCIPAAGVTIDERVLLINDLLAFDRNLPISDTNHPRLMISETCANLIYSMREWTGVDGQKGASKDPIDALGYLVVMNPQYVGGAKWAKWNKEAQNVGSY